MPRRAAEMSAPDEARRLVQEMAPTIGPLQRKEPSTALACVIVRDRPSAPLARRGGGRDRVEVDDTVTSSKIVALVGRPNVGKSALFNRFLGRRLAIVEETPGVTRDRLYAPVEWAGRHFTVVDTGGIDTGDVDDIMAQTRAQAELAIREADVVIFVVDAQTGVVSGDDDVA